MTKTLVTFMLIGGVILLSYSPGYGKGPSDLIVILAGSGSSYEVTDKQTLQQFSAWNGEFVDWSKGAVRAPLDLSNSCKVFFYQKWPGRRSSNYDRGELKMIYTLSYVPPGHEGQPGYVYLPGKGEEFFANNISTIIREQDDGKWHQASAAWDALMNRLLHARN